MTDAEQALRALQDLLGDVLCEWERSLMPTCPYCPGASDEETDRITELRGVAAADGVPAVLARLAELKPKS